ncbi:hypothetical protein [Echinicola rosea]|uniref:hypothetical protein n=1 Tax=Echinicola rosea TaxID=1807691 RepID=UPI0016515A8C|nr:hypothetical protein [Echinicola rosea]
MLHPRYSLATVVLLRWLSGVEAIALFVTEHAENDSKDYFLRVILNENQLTNNK